MKAYVNKDSFLYAEYIRTLKENELYNIVDIMEASAEKAEYKTKIIDQILINFNDNTALAYCMCRDMKDIQRLNKAVFLINVGLGYPEIILRL